MYVGRLVGGKNDGGGWWCGVRKETLSLCVPIMFSQGSVGIVLPQHEASMPRFSAATRFLSPPSRSHGALVVLSPLHVFVPVDIQMVCLRICYAVPGEGSVRTGLIEWWSAGRDGAW